MANNDAAAAAAAVEFALTPAMVSIVELDYNSKTGQNIWTQAIKELSSDGFDCVSDGLRDFNQLAARRGQLMGWNLSVLAIPENNADPLGATFDFFEKHGQVTKEQLEAFATTFRGTPSRMAQDDIQMYHCFMNSLSKIGRDKISLRSEEYTKEGTPSGILLLKVIITESTIDTNATTSAIRRSLATLDDYMPTIGYDISKFNRYVKSQVEALKARGKESHDLTTNLFRAYLTVKDKEFKAYIALKESDHEENNIELEYEHLMTLAENKFKIRKIRGTWNAPSREEEKTVALEAKLKRLESKPPDFKTPKPDYSSRGNTGAVNKPGSAAKKSPNRREEPWMLIAPKEGETKTKDFNGKTWHWCPNHKKWCVHKPEDCKGISKGSAPEKKGELKNTKYGGKPERKAQFARAYASLAEESDDDD
jgi:hypothetical protein